MTVIARAVAKKINDVKGPGTVNKCVVQKWVRCFKEDDTNLEGKSRSERLVEHEVLLEMIEQQPSTGALLAELGLTQKIIKQHLHISSQSYEQMHKYLKYKKRWKYCKTFDTPSQNLILVIFISSEVNGF